MQTEAAGPLAMSEALASASLPKPRRRRFAGLPPLAGLGMVFLAILCAQALFANQLAPHDPTQQRLRGRLLPPVPFARSDSSYPLGTDHLGRDVLSRIMYGSRVSLAVGLAAVAIGGVLGCLAGLFSGYVGGRVDQVLMSLADIQLAIPVILLGIAVIAVVGASLRNLIVVVGISGWVSYARVSRSAVLALREREFVEAVRASGGTGTRILFRHILPNIVSLLIVLATLDLARAIILESTLSFLGLGVQPPTPTWGTMLSEGRQYQATAWWIATLPGLVLMLTALSANWIGDWLRDRADPTQRWNL